jgi:hypothetical protein
MKKNYSHKNPNNKLSKTQIDWIRKKLYNAETNGFTQGSKDQILAESKSLL